jgi:hypothetical protein
MRKLKTLPPSHLEKVIREGKPVYVINTSALPSGDKGMVIINFFDGTRREFFKMPPTFIPMAITDSITPNKLMDSKDFRQSLLKGMLTLVDPSSAEAYLNSREAQDEYESLVLSEHSQKAQNIDVNRSVSRRGVHHSSNEGHGPVQDVTAVDTVSNKVRGIIESMVAETLTSKEALIQLRRHQSALHPVDFSYVVANASDPELKKWAKSGLSRTTKEQDAWDEEEEEYDDDEEGLEDDEEEIDGDIKPTKIKKNPGRPKGSVKKESSPEKSPEKAVKKNQNYADVFDFKKDPVDEMTAEDAATDARAKAMAMANQSIGGQSMYQQEINKILAGQV